MVQGAATLRNVTFDAIVLAGGGSTRFGTDKAAVLVDGVTMLDRVLLVTASATATVVVGPPRPTVRPVTWTLEDPPSGGPVAAIAAGLRHGTSPLVAVLSCDLPHLTAADLDRLVTRLTEPVGPDDADADAPEPDLVTRDDHAPDLAAVDGYGLRDSSGHPQRLATVYRRDALIAAVERLGDPHGRAVRDLVADLRMTWTDPNRAGDDADTWADLQAITTNPDHPS